MIWEDLDSKKNKSFNESFIKKKKKKKECKK
jgi:hypothetical protein